MQKQQNMIQTRHKTIQISDPGIRSLSIRPVVVSVLLVARIAGQKVIGSDLASAYFAFGVL